MLYFEVNVCLHPGHCWALCRTGRAGFSLSFCHLNSVSTVMAKANPIVSHVGKTSDTSATVAQGPPGLFWVVGLGHRVSGICADAMALCPSVGR